MINLKKYEYKAPSYERFVREKHCVIDEKAAKEESRFVQEDGMWRAKAEDKDEISLLFGGDLLCQENMISKFSTKEGRYDFHYCFEFLRPLFKAADFVAGNLETPVTDFAPYRGEIITHEGPFFCNAPVEYMEALKYCGFDMLTTANNHTLDAGAEGMYDTIVNMDKFGFIHTGTFYEKCDKFVIVDICGFKVGFTAFGTAYNMMQNNLTKEGRITLLNTYTTNRATKVLEEMKAKGAEYTIAFPHWGKEYTDILSPKQLDRAEEMTEMGYDLVVGAHSHVVQRFEEVNGKPVLYSLGNLISHMNNLTPGSAESQYPVLMNLKLKRVDGKIEPSIDFIPCRIFKELNGLPFVVVPVDENLELPAEITDKLEKTPAETAKLLIKDEDILNTNYPVDAKAKKELDEFLANYRVKMEDLCEKKPMSLAAEEIPEEKEKGLKLLKKMVANPDFENRIGKYKVYEDYAELLCIDAKSSVVKLDKEVEGKPVTVISNYKQRNDTARIIYMGNHVQVVGKRAFAGFSRLESVRFYGNTEVIEEEAFANCASLSGIILPKSMTAIKSRAFANCPKLMSIKIPEGVTEISNDAFAGSPKVVIYCEKGSYAEKFAKKRKIKMINMPLNPLATKGKEEKKAVQQPATENVVTRSMNLSPDAHPVTIQSVCRILGVPLPADAVCSKMPSEYMPKGILKANPEFVRDALGQFMPDMDDDELKKWFRFFKRKYQSQTCLEYNANDLVVLFCDWILYARDRGFSQNDYFDYELYNKSPELRDTFINRGYGIRLFNSCRTKEKGVYFRKKALFNETFKKYVHRDWLDMEDCTFEEFKEFCEKHDKFFAKPTVGTGGKGARVIKVKEYSLEELYKICIEEKMMVEEQVQQHESLAEFNAGSLNTTRVISLVCADGVARILFAVVRFGRAGTVVDNFHGGGVGAIIDPETGVIISKAVNGVHELVDVHPDSGKPFIGFQFPEWEKVKAAVLDAAMMIPEMRSIGWDVSVTKDGEVEFIEGNSKSGFHLTQTPDQIGKKYKYETYLKEIEELKGINIEEPGPVKVIEYDAPVREKGIKAKKNKAASQTGNSVSVLKRVKRVLKKIIKK